MCSTYLLVSLQNSCWEKERGQKPESSIKEEKKRFSAFQFHPQWNSEDGWKNWLNNLRLILQPFVAFNLIKTWLKIFPISQLSQKLSRLVAIMNFFIGAVPDCTESLDFNFSSA